MFLKISPNTLRYKDFYFHQTFLYGCYLMLSFL